MDAKDSLRRYLEQRRELGESELVLDSLSIEEAMKLLGAAKSSPKVKAPETTDWRAAVRAAGGAPEARPSLGTPEIPEDPPTEKQVLRSAQDDNSTGRQVLHSAQDDKAPAATSAVHVPTTQTEGPAAPVVLLEDVPVGLVVGGVSRAIFDDPAFKLDSLEAIADAVTKCTRCPLYATAKNPVPGTGNPNADFMIVGEAPGANEDEQGVPFVGQAGQLLTKIIGAINLSRDDVFIANVLKHRPPGNRNPLPEEVTACSPYLVRQIELVRPKVILALGTFAAQTLLETKSTIGKLRGQIHRYYGVPLIVTYHPAALLRNPAWKRPTWEDVQLARRILDRPDAPRA
jgi:uracil-DNA glycosylase family 4